MLKRRNIVFLIGCLLVLPLGAQTNSEWNQKDQEGRKSGPWKAYYPGGQLRLVGQFDMDQPVDTFYYYYEDGKLKSVLIHDPEVQNKVLAMHFYSTGDTLAKGPYVGQKKNGIWRTYGDESILLTQGRYVDDKQDGEWTTYYPNGKIAEVKYYKADIEDGSYKAYYENGELNLDMYFVDGAPHGLATFYHPNGKKQKEGNYKQGLKDGKWVEYGENGLATKLLIYENGKLTNPEVLDSLDYNKEEYRSQRKDYLEFEDIRGRINYE